MALQLPFDLIAPRYGHSALADLVPAIAHRLGHEPPGESPVPAAVGAMAAEAMELPHGTRWVVALIDGLGTEQLAAHSAHAPYLSGLLARNSTAVDTLTCGVPATTVTSLTSLGTGLVPGTHGVVGYACRNPRDGQFLNLLTWEGDVTPTEFQPHPTMLAVLQQAGVAVTAVAPAQFNGSGLTQVSLSGGDFAGVHDETDEEARIDLAVAAATAGESSFVYFYERELDHTGHGRGVDSPEWRSQLRRIDALCEALREELPDQVRLVITGDHGMVDVAPEQQIVVEDHPRLGSDLQVLAGEGRFRQLYTTHGQQDAVARRWADELGERALVVRREEAFEAGWFGPVAESVTQRYGDVLVAMRDTWAVLTRELPGEMNLVGMHGSLTPAEMLVPLLVD